MKILNFGSCNIDYVYSLDHIVRNGETQSVRQMQTFAGGKGLNQSVALSRAGARVYHAGCIGHDGEMLRELLFECGVDTSYLRTVDCKNGHAIIQVSDAGDNCIIVLHPANLSWENRMACLENLRSLGYQVGAGFMVGSPFQTEEMLARELCFIEQFKPDMCGIGPFIPHKETDFAGFGAGSVEMTCRLLACIRLIHPTILLPATTALGTLHPHGREMGIWHGANVVMPNLSPASVRKKYMLYDNKRSDGDESAQALAEIKRRLQDIGCEVAVERGDRAGM